MSLNAKILQRAILAFTTGLFLACSARMSAAQQPRGDQDRAPHHVAPATTAFQGPSR
jgi:hypothetical protein